MPWSRYRRIIKHLPLGLGQQARHNNSLGWLDGLSDGALAARLLAGEGGETGAEGGGTAHPGAAGGVRREELAAGRGSGATAPGRRPRCHVVRAIEVSVTSSDQVGTQVQPGWWGLVRCRQPGCTVCMACQGGLVVLACPPGLLSSQPPHAAPCCARA